MCKLKEYKSICNEIKVTDLVNIQVLGSGDGEVDLAS